MRNWKESACKKMDITEKTYLAHGDPSLEISDKELDDPVK